MIKERCRRDIVGPGAPTGGGGPSTTNLQQALDNQAGTAFTTGANQFNLVVSGAPFTVSSSLFGNYFNLSGAGADKISMLVLLESITMRAADDILISANGATNTITITSNNGNINISSGGELTFDDINIALPILMSDSLNTSFNTTNKTVVGAVNELESELSNHGLQEAYEAGSSIELDDGIDKDIGSPTQSILNVLWDTGESDTHQCTINADLIELIGGTIDIDGSSISLQSSTSITLKDQYLTSSITVSESGETELDTTSNSIVGAINELNAGASTGISHFLGAFNGQATSTTAKISQVSTQTYLDYFPTDSSADFYQNGRINPWCTGITPITLRRITIFLAQAAVAQATVGATPSVKIEIHSQQIAGRTSLGTFEIPLTPGRLNVGIFNNLGTNFLFAYTYTKPIGILIPARTLFGASFINENTNNNQINAIGRLSICLEG